MLRQKISTVALAIALVAPVTLQCVPDTSDTEVNPAAFLLPIIIAQNRPCSSTAVSATLGEALTFTAANGLAVVSVPAGATTVRIINGTNNALAALTTSFRAAQCLSVGESTDVPFSSFRDITIPAGNQPQLNMFFPTGSNPTSFTVQVTFN